MKLFEITLVEQEKMRPFFTICMLLIFYNSAFAQSTPSTTETKTSFDFIGVLDMSVNQVQLKWFSDNGRVNLKSYPEALNRVYVGPNQSYLREIDRKTITRQIPGYFYVSYDRKSIGRIFAKFRKKIR